MKLCLIVGYNGVFDIVVGNSVNMPSDRSTAAKYPVAEQILVHIGCMELRP